MRARNTATRELIQGEGVRCATIFHLDTTPNYCCSTCMYIRRLILRWPMFIFLMFPAKLIYAFVGVPKEMYQMFLFLKSN